MSVKVSNEKELGEALSKDEDCIELIGETGPIVFKIKATGKVAWAVCIGSIAIAITAIIMAPPTGGASTPAAVAGGAAAVILGAPVATSCVAIAIAAGGVGALNKLRGYEIIERDGRTFLEKK